MKTIRGVYYNLEESDIFSKVDGFLFYFSSKFNKKRFDNNLTNYVKIESCKNNNKYQFKINLNLYLTIAFYCKIEKRGFRIIDSTNNKQIKKDTIIINTIL